MKLIYSVKEIFSEYLKSGEYFVIPAYQRGYKWKTTDIEQLLNDINRFQTNGDDEIFYCLQNITLIKNNRGYNVVDGQQRLTTLSLLLAYFREIDLIENKLQYAIREESMGFLTEYVFTWKLNEFGKNKTEDGLPEWNELEIDEQYNYQDIFYMYNACRTIELWFKEHSTEEEIMKDKILNHVKLIVNLTQLSSEQEFALFDNLNGKRVPLDGADLIRAMIITRVARKEVEDICDTTKHDVILNENRVKNGLVLDAINAWWCDKERQNYFRHFIRKIDSKGEHIKFEESKYPIDTLYKLVIQTSEGQKLLGINKESSKELSKGGGTIKLHFFENSENLCQAFTYMQDVQRLVEYWYNDSELYHLVMYCAVYLGMAFYELVELWNSNNRSSSINELKKKILEQEFIKAAIEPKDEDSTPLLEEDIDFKQNWYDDEDVIPVMVLLDIIRILDSKKSMFPIANLDSGHFRADKEDKEHIFPQTPLSEGYNKETLMLYIDIAYKCGYKEFEKDKVLRFVNENWDRIKDRDNFREWFNKTMTSEIIPINSLGNVCLLQDKVNRSYGNDTYTQKHFDIIKKSLAGEYIRPHVLDAFSKVMATDGQRQDPSYMMQWDKEDIVARRKYIVEQIRGYLITKI